MARHVLGIREALSSAMLAWVVAACGGEGAPDPWYADSPPGAFPNEVRTRRDAWLVVEERLEAAVAKLETESFAPLDATEASELTGKSLSTTADSGFYLLRGVRYNPGPVDVTTVGRTVLVQQSSMGRSTPPMVKQPVVARLPDAPEQVYATCTIDE